MGRPRQWFDADGCVEHLKSLEVFDHIPEAALRAFLRKRMPEGQLGDIRYIIPAIHGRFGMSCEQCGNGGGIRRNDKRLCQDCFSFYGVNAWTIGLPNMLWKLKAAIRERT